MKVLEMPVEDLAAVAEKPAPVLRELESWIECCHVAAPVAVVVPDSCYPMLLYLADLEVEVVFYEWDAGYAKLISCRQGDEHNPSADPLPHLRSRRLERRGVEVLCKNSVEQTEGATP